MVINSPFHPDCTTLSGEEWNHAANIIMDRYEWSPFGHQASAPPASTLNTFGHTDKARWLTFHSVGNERNHTLFPGLTAMFLHPDPVRCLHNEPYYDGLHPLKQLLQPYQTTNTDKNMGWAYCMRDEAKKLFLMYFEKGCKRANLSGAFPKTAYKLSWFDPMVVIDLPDYPGGADLTERDWAAKLIISSYR